MARGRRDRAAPLCANGCVSGGRWAWRKAGYSTGKCICQVSGVSSLSCGLLPRISRKLAKRGECRPLERRACPLRGRPEDGTASAGQGEAQRMGTNWRDLLWLGRLAAMSWDLQGHVPASGEA
uniref:Uncharacterized protein n=1 Tax=Podarcis muralis TaxID=64176 RepID=A0A670JK87_PODMU